MDVDGPPGFDSLLQGNKNIPGGKKGSKVELSGMCYHVYDNASGRYGMLSGTEGSLRSWACLLVLVIMKFCKERNDLKWLPLCSWHNTVYVLKEFPRALEVGVQMKRAGGEVISLEHWWPGEQRSEAARPRPVVLNGPSCPAALGGSNG